MTSLVIAVLMSIPSGHSAIKLSSGIFVEASWYPGSASGRRGSIIVSVKDGKKFRKETVPLASNSWPELHVPQRPPALLTPGIKEAEAVLDLTLSVESGAYGYKRVVTYSLTPLAKKLLNPIGRPFEFSDHGSWRRLNHHTIEYWDSIWDETLSHQAPHPYKLTRISQGTTVNKILSVRQTTRKYNFIWYSDQKAQSSFFIKGDPLRELGSKWTWWGELLPNDSPKK